MSDDDDASYFFCFKITLAERSQAHIFIVTLGTCAGTPRRSILRSIICAMLIAVAVGGAVAAVTIVHCTHRYRERGREGGEREREQSVCFLECTKYNTSNRAPNLLAWS